MYIQYNEWVIFVSWREHDDGNVHNWLNAAEKQTYQFYSLWFHPTGARIHDLFKAQATITPPAPMWFSIYAIYDTL